MKFTHRVDKNNLMIRLDAETQAESAELFSVANACKKPVEANGWLGEEKTFVWLSIPIARRRSFSFGNGKKITA